MVVSDKLQKHSKMLKAPVYERVWVWKQINLHSFLENASDCVSIGFSFESDWLKKVARVIWTSHAARKSKTKAIPNYFWHPIETCSKRSSIFTDFERKWLLGFCIPHSWLPNRGLTGHHKLKTESVSVEASASWSSPSLASSSQQDKQHQKHQWLQYYYYDHHHH